MAKIQVHRGDIVFNVNLSDNKPYNITYKSEQKKALEDLRQCADPSWIFAVKVVDENAGERFWCRVLKVDDDKIHATVDNDLIISNLKYGDELTFGIESIIGMASKKIDPNRDACMVATDEYFIPGLMYGYCGIE